jgi:hypothetical protein
VGIGEVAFSWLCVQIDKKSVSHNSLTHFLLCSTGADVPLTESVLALMCEGQELDAVYFEAFATTDHGAPCFCNSFRDVAETASVATSFFILGDVRALSSAVALLCSSSP